MAALRFGTLVISAVALSLALLPALAESAGTITGRITFTGKVPDPKEFEFSKFPNENFCKQNESKSKDGNIRLLKEVQVTEDGGLKDAIIAVKGIKDDKWKKSYEGTKVLAELCEWSDFTGVVVNRRPFIVENTDADPNDPKSVEGVLHNPHSFEVLKASSSTIFNIGLAKKGDSLNKKPILRRAKKGSVMRLQCDQHEFMQAWFLPVNNPYFTKVDDKGNFTLKDVPDGKHKVAVWHPKLGFAEKEIEVKAGGETSLNVDMAAAKKTLKKKKK